MHVSFASLIIIALSATTMFAADTAPTGPPSLLPVCGANCAKSVAPRTSCKDVGNITCQCSDQNYSTLMNLCILASQYT
ncbi:BQ2448_3655 [Microbotryum intermedium]|uniref:BQ2448_3655 protein n=1 Tax=Microbotryum intermedium TaxID=269621 RepID=A0A238FFV7_9BASI|nr:BQ2448_3655 [Microbotryum intermedium]